jgi:hypothetical protein
MVDARHGNDYRTAAGRGHSRLKQSSAFVTFCSILRVRTAVNAQMNLTEKNTRATKSVDEKDFWSFSAPARAQRTLISVARLSDREQENAV